VTVAVVGAGLAGLHTCEALRRRGYDGRVVLIGAEPHPPYDRPPLSKEVLRGERPADAATLRSCEDLAANGIELVQGHRATALNVRERVVTLDDGTSVDYDDAVIATGATPRALPGVAADGIRVLRTIDDCVALRDALTDAARVVVVGAGFIGLEVAASARARGCEVVVVDVLPGPLGRAIDPAVGQAISALHAEHGVEVRCGLGVASVDADGPGRALRFTDGTQARADVVVAGVGVEPATQWLAGSGLTVDNGVVCDPSLSAAPHVWAVGDVARWAAPAMQAHVRVEHWTNAAEQGAAAARNLLATAAGDEAAEGMPYEPVPFFWSDQYSDRLQFLGRASGDDEVEVVAGSVEERSFLALYGRGGRLRGALGLNQPRLVMPYRKLLLAGVSWDDALTHAAATTS
jgi:NADPH-dependent 2,4-dienoyl-CoA reductase/sulfur reductase-like enzyme